MADVIWYQNNASPAVTDAITVAGVAQNLTGATVRFRARDPRNSTLVIDQAATIPTPASGVVAYTPTLTDTSVAYQVPPLAAWWHITLSGGAVQDTPEFNLFIRGHAEARSTDLCTLSDVKNALRITSHDRDDEIQSRLSEASVMIQRWIDLRVAPASTGVTYSFPLDISGGDLVVELNPYVLRAASTVTLSPEGAATVLASSQYQLEPITAPDGIYKRIRLSPFIGGVISTNALKFGNAIIAITGNWGYLTVGDAMQTDLAKACNVTVASWIDVAYGAYAARDVYGDDPRQTYATPESTYGLPLAAQRILGTYKRMVP